MRKAYCIFAVLSILLGLAHVGFTGVFYPQLDLAAAWFAGTGLSLIFLGVLNLVVAGISRGYRKWLTLLCNSMGLLLFVAIAVMIKSPQGYLGVLLVLGLLLLGLKDQSSSDR
jgi:hypothetical protein